MNIGFLLHLQSSRSSGEVNLQWTVEYMRWAPDCVDSVVIGINGSYPGPTIDAIAGDTINIELINHLHTEGVVIHWHGITQKGTPWADGTASISQCAINSGETFVYTFKVEKAGTFFYHGHYGMQRSAGLYGALIVRESDKSREPFKYDQEHTLLLSDWWYQSVHRQEVELSSTPIRFIGEPQAILINGRGQSGCSAFAPPGSEGACKYKETPKCEPQPIKVQPHETHRIRIASTTALSSLNFKIAGHQLEVVEADGNYIKPFLVDDLDIYSGESYSVLVKANSELIPQNYWISVGVRGRNPATLPALTIRDYHNSPDQPVQLPSAGLPIHPEWNKYDYSKSFSNKIKALIKPELKDYTYKPPPRKQDRRIVLLNAQNQIEKKTLWTINHISLKLPNTQYLGATKYKLNAAFDQTNPPDIYPDALNYDINVRPPLSTKATYSNGVFNLKSNQVIDVILQNANMLTDRHSELHPWHLHGHDFWVLGYGEGKFVDGDENKFNLDDPPLRNTVVVYPYGWTALRFETDNPGVWAFHCHIEPHLHMGMGVIFAEGIDEIQNMKINKKALVCGLTGEMFMNSHND